MPTANESFLCFSCRRKYKWRSEDAGRTFRCQCGIKLRCPDPEAEDWTAEESLDDTVTDVVLEEAFDDIESATPTNQDLTISQSIESPDFAEEIVPRRVSGGLFGLGPAGEALFWGVVALVCLLSFILFAYVPGWVYLIIGVVTFWGLWKFWVAWKNWTRGRPWHECLDELFSSS
jgi:hypothetical protein